MFSTTKTPTTTRRARINISHNSKGYNHDTTAEVESDGDVLEELERLIAATDAIARCEIADRIYLDNHPEAGRITRNNEDAPDTTVDDLIASGVDLTVTYV